MGKFIYSDAATIIKEDPYELIRNADYVASWGEEYTSESIFNLHISDLSSSNRELSGYLNNTDLITPNWNDYRCVMPIPQAEIDANLNLSGQQDPGY